MLKLRGKVIISFTLVLVLLFPHTALAAGINISNTSTEPSQLPDIAVQGNFVYVVWQETDSNDISFRRSVDNGISFETNQIVSGTLPGFEPNIATSGTNVYISWHTSNDIIFTRSTNNGIIFEPPSIIYSSPQGTEEVTMTSGDNEVFISFGSFSAGGADVFFLRSLDQGVTFSTPTNLSNSQNDNRDERIATSEDGKDVYVVWVEDVGFPAIAEITASHNSGLTFLPPKTLPTNNVDIDQTRVTTNQNGKLVSVAWRVSPEFGISDEIWLSQSFSNGNTFSQAINVSNSPETSSPSNSPSLSMNTLGIISIAWVEGFTGDIFQRQILGGVLTAITNISQTTEGSLEPQVDIDNNGNSYIIWQEELNPSEILFSKISP